MITKSFNNYSNKKEYLKKEHCRLEHKYSNFRSYFNVFHISINSPVKVIYIAICWERSFLLVYIYVKLITPGWIYLVVFLT